MTDPLRSDRPGDVPDRERDGRIEELLLTGLEHYFGGQHELAINVWTRVLFLDRNHARARAYIERARSALSEKQREGEELLHSGAAALNRGDRDAARQLLTSAIERGASGEDALALLHRLDRLDAASTEVAPVSPSLLSKTQQRSSMSVVAARRDSRLAWIGVGIVAGVLIAAAAGSYLWIVVDPFALEYTRTPPPAVTEDPLPVPAACEIRLVRARNLVASGRLHEALAELDAGDPDERHRASMNELRASIQRSLLAAGRQNIPRATAGEGPTRQTPPRPAGSSQQ